jgi:hypothetical protein
MAKGVHDQCVKTNLDALLTALYVHPPSGGPAPIVCDKGLAGAGIEKATAELGHLLIRPARDDEPEPRANIFPAWPRQQIEAIT